MDSYYNAFDEINKMLKGDTIISLNRAVFLVENAYYDNSYDYKDFQQSIQNGVQICNEIIESQKWDKNSNIVKNSTIFRT